MEITLNSEHHNGLLPLAHSGVPPFAGTVWVTPEILGPDDPSSFGSVTYTGRGTREIFDRRANAWIMVNAYLFDVRFGERTVGVAVQSRIRQ